MIGWILVLATLSIAACIGYVIFVKVKDGQQPGEAWIDALLARMRRERPPTVPATPTPVTPTPVVPVQPKPPPVAAAATLGAVNMHPWSNAYSFDPPLPDASPRGFGLFYPVGRDAATGKSIPAGPPKFVYAENITGEDTEDAAVAALERLKKYDAEAGERARKFNEAWAAQRFDGPFPAAYWASDQSMFGSLAYAASRVGDYHRATGRDLFRDLFSGTNPEIVHARNVAEAHANQGLSYDPALPGAIDSLMQRYQR